MKNIITFIFLFVALLQVDAQKKKSIHSYKMTEIAGKTIKLSKYKGKKILIVNTASHCGFTRQYKDLERLHNDYKDKIVVLGFPANNFGGQEPGSNEEIASFCEVNYGVTFPLSEKISVKGEDIAPLYRFLTQKKYNGVSDTEIKWNFEKFLIDEKGFLIDHFVSKVEPLDESIIKHLK